eukprot:TRINITY_DN6927_c0_g1_i1.p2 TRINITY_DN6927_c0_g1~~TRINITY_DN6927_c0_g1_i1.p2  ORF type:complete len:136 (+),score=23.62 TRINITY_DN6927_c0_g1_i1:699-1106(+)
MCGKVPFGEESEDPYEICEEIFKGSLSYPAFLTDRKARKLMDQLINKVPEVRLSGSYAALKGNAWFDDIDWDKLADYQIKPPYVPPEKLVMSQEDAKKMIDTAIPVTDKIVSDQKKMGVKNKELVSKFKDWDEMF